MTATTDITNKIETEIEKRLGAFHKFGEGRKLFLELLEKEFPINENDDYLDRDCNATRRYNAYELSVYAQHMPIMADCYSLKQYLQKVL